MCKLKICSVDSWGIWNCSLHKSNSGSKQQYRLSFNLYNFLVTLKMFAIGIVFSIFTVYLDA